MQKIRDASASVCPVELRTGGGGEEKRIGGGDKYISTQLMPPSKQQWSRSVMRGCGGLGEEGVTPPEVWEAFT